MSKVRIQKVLSELGIASRRAAEEMVLDGRISVNGRTVTELPVFVDARTDRIKVDGRAVRIRPGSVEKVYYLLNKPRGVVCTNSDPAGRPRAVDLAPPAPGLHCVGRLDKESTGLIVLTNDGDLTQRLTHPRYGVVKTYVVEVDGWLDEKQIARLKGPAHVDGRRTRGARVRVLHRGRARSVLEINLREGMNREIRRLLARLGHKVRRLKRTAIGPVTDRGVKVGGYRRLTGPEVASLRRSAREAGSKKGGSQARKPGRP